MDKFFRKIALGVGVTAALAGGAKAENNKDSTDKKVPITTKTIEVKENKNENAKPLVNWFSRDKKTEVSGAKDKKGNVIMDPNTHKPLHKEVITTTVPDSKLSKGFIETETIIEKLKKTPAQSATEGNTIIGVSDKVKLVPDEIAQGEMSIHGKQNLMQSEKSLNIEQVLKKNQYGQTKLKGSIGEDTYNDYSSDQVRTQIPNQPKGNTTGHYEATFENKTTKPFGYVGISNETKDDPERKLDFNLNVEAGAGYKNERIYAVGDLNPSLKLHIKNEKTNKEYGNIEGGVNLKTAFTENMYSPESQRDVNRSSDMSHFNSNVYIKGKANITDKLSAEASLQKEVTGDVYGKVGLNYKLGGKDKSKAKTEVIQQKTVKFKPLDNK